MSKVTISKEAAKLIEQWTYKYIEWWAKKDFGKFIDSLVEPEKVEKNCDTCNNNYQLGCFLDEHCKNFRYWQPKEEIKTYPCKDCGKLRTKEEGGTTFTVCDECWDKKYKKVTPTLPDKFDDVKEYEPITNTTLIDKQLKSYDNPIKAKCNDLIDYIKHLEQRVRELEAENERA